MAGLRERKKNMIRSTILQVSRRAFMENGYNNTSTKEIARQSEIGAGTLFNYFPTKADILLEIISMEADDMSSNPESMLLPGECARDLIYGFLMKFIAPVMTMPRSITREFITSSMPLARKGGSLVQKVIDADMNGIDKLIKLIDDLEAKGVIASVKDSKVLAKLIFSSLFLDVSTYLFDDRVSKEDLFSNLKNSIAYLVDA